MEISFNAKEENNKRRLDDFSRRSQATITKN